MTWRRFDWSTSKLLECATAFDPRRYGELLIESAKESVRIIKRKRIVLIALSWNPRWRIRNRCHSRFGHSCIDESINDRLDVAKKRYKNVWWHVRKIWISIHILLREEGRSWEFKWTLKKIRTRRRTKKKKISSIEKRKSKNEYNWSLSDIWWCSECSE